MYINQLYYYIGEPKISFIYICLNCLSIISIYTNYIDFTKNRQGLNSNHTYTTVYIIYSHFGNFMYLHFPYICLYNVHK